MGLAGEYVGRMQEKKMTLKFIQLIEMPPVCHWARRQWVYISE